LRASGWHVHDCSRLGGGYPDLNAAKGGRLLLIEVKDGSKVASAQKLTAEEIKVHQAFQLAGVPVVVVTSVEQAVRL
jgi:Holliday junction resolvase